MTLDFSFLFLFFHQKQNVNLSRNRLVHNCKYLDKQNFVFWTQKCFILTNFKYLLKSTLWHGECKTFCRQTTSKVYKFIFCPIQNFVRLSTQTSSNDSFNVIENIAIGQFVLILIEQNILFHKYSSLLRNYKA